MTLQQISTIIYSGFAPFYLMDSSGNYILDTSNNRIIDNSMTNIIYINNQINAAIANLPVGATYLNHTITPAELTTPPIILLLTIFFNI